MNFFINSAYAQTADAAAQPNPMFQFVIFGGFALIFYFMIWRPQSKRSKEQKSLIESLGKGDEVMTTGGLLGKITKIEGDYVALNVAENVEIKMQKTSVAAILPKGTIKSI
jgi:preprotein translocase subunit YajC